MLTSKTRVLFIMTGSIACYKAAQLISRLVQKNIEVQVVATASALQFIGEATLEGLSGQAVLSDIYARGHMMEHIHLVREADLILVAPATSNFINKMAAGLGDDLASTLMLAHDFQKPLVIAPAMNSQMYLHPVTGASLQKLKSYPGVTVLETAEGVLACGEEGPGKLLEPDLILDFVLKHLATGEKLRAIPVEKFLSANEKKLKVLVTAGGTQEKIDQVRVLSNLSTGRTGVEMARNLHELGLDVTLLLASSSPYRTQSGMDLRPQSSFTLKTFTDYQSLKDLLFHEVKNESYDVLIHSAAVSDYSVDKIQSTDGKDLQSEKISGAGDIVLRLKKNPKLIDEVKALSKNKNIRLIGFKLTSHSSEEQIYEKVSQLFSMAHCDFVVHNDTTQIDKKKNTHSFNFCALDNNKKIEFKECNDINQLNFEISKAILSEATL